MVMDDYVKHCRLCEKCMIAIDHHCLFLMHCIAVNNHRAFVTFLFVVVTGNLLFFRAALTCKCDFEIMFVDGRYTGICFMVRS